MKKVLMCPPEYYDIEYSINPWMKTNNKVDKAKAFRQYQCLKDQFIAKGITVKEFNPVKGLPDMIFATNAGYVENNIFIKSNFKAIQRFHEADSAVEYFKKLGYEIKYLPEDLTFEGEGDLIRSETKYFLGYGSRSDKRAANLIGEIIDKEIFNLELVNPYFYHLDTCFAPLNDGTVVVNKDAFTNKGYELIKSKFENIITTCKADNNILGCNLIVKDKEVFIGRGISDELKEKITNFGFNVNELEMSEFLKGGGSVKCITLEIFE